jgi:hypothetical protein
MRGVSCLAKGPLGDMPLRDSFDPFNSIKDPATSCGVEGQWMKMTISSMFEHSSMSYECASILIICVDSVNWALKHWHYHWSLY